MFVYGLCLFELMLCGCGALVAGLLMVLFFDLDCLLNLILVFVCDCLFGFFAGVLLDSYLLVVLLLAVIWLVG